MEIYNDKIHHGYINFIISNLKYIYVTRKMFRKFKSQDFSKQMFNEKVLINYFND